MLENTEGVIQNGKFRDMSNIRQKTQNEDKQNKKSNQPNRKLKI